MSLRGRKCRIPISLALFSLSLSLSLLYRGLDLVPVSLQQKLQTANQDSTCYVRQ